MGEVHDFKAFKDQQRKLRNAKGGVQIRIPASVVDLEVLEPEVCHGEITLQSVRDRLQEIEDALCGSTEPPISSHILNTLMNVVEVEATEELIRVVMFNVPETWSKHRPFYIAVVHVLRSRDFPSR